MKKLFYLIPWLAVSCWAQLPPPPATQAEVDAGTDSYKYVSPFTLANWTGAGSGFPLTNNETRSVAFLNSLFTIGDTTGSNVINLSGDQGFIGAGSAGFVFQDTTSSIHVPDGVEFSGTNIAEGTIPSNRLAFAIGNTASRRIGFVGDSITSAEMGWFTNLMNIYLTDFDGTNVAVSGYTTSQMITQLNTITNWLAKTDDSQVRYCWVFGWVNDPGNGISISQTLSNMATIWTTLTNLGVTPIVGPMYNAATSPNAWIRTNYAGWKTLFVDMEQLMNNSADGMTYDGLHPSVTGGAKIAEAIASVLGRGSVIPVATPKGTNHNYWGTANLKDTYFGAGGSSNLVLQTDGWVKFPSGIRSNTIIDGNLTVSLSGENVVSNGYFTANANGWSAVASSLSSVANGVDGNCLQVLNASSSPYCYAVQSFTTIPNQPYVFSGYYFSSNNASQEFYIGTNAVNGLYVDSGLIRSSNSWSVLRSNFIPTTATTYLTLYSYAPTNTAVLFDSITIAPANTATFTVGSASANSAAFGHTSQTTINTNGHIGVRATPLSTYSLTVGVASGGSGSISASGLASLQGGVIGTSATFSTDVGARAISASTTITSTNGFGIGADTINSWDDVTNYFTMPSGGTGGTYQWTNDVNADGNNLYEAATIYGSSNSAALTLTGSADAQDNAISIYRTNSGNGIAYFSQIGHEFTGPVSFVDGVGNISAGTVAATGNLTATGTSNYVAALHTDTFAMDELDVENLYATNVTFVGSVSYSTNAATIAPNFNLSYQLWATNAAFTFGLPLNLDATKFQSCVVLVTNSTAAAVAITPPAAVVTSGTWYCTNVTEFTFRHYGGMWTNAVALPLW